MSAASFSLVLALAASTITVLLAWWQARRREEYWHHLLRDLQTTWQKKLRQRLRASLALERQLALLRTLATRMTLTSRLEETLEVVMEMLHGALRLDAVLIFGTNGQEDALSLIAARGLDAAERERWQQVRVEGRTITPLGKDGAGAAEDGSDVVRFAVPLVARGRTIGLLAVGIRTPRELTPEEVSLLETVADYLAMAMENSHLYQNLRRYVQQITMAQENERRRIARELHDSTLQSLIAILYHLVCFLRERRDLSMNDSR
ncbi:MAG: GAF domain-containing protein, partial [Clostridia bacterium]|nr:GAF domain-containing protein [Clostridia bacterium]